MQVTGANWVPVAGANLWNERDSPILLTCKIKTCNIIEINLKYILVIPEIYLRCTKYTSEIYMRYTKDIPEI